MNDIISRADAIEAVIAEGRKVHTSEYANAERIIYEADATEALSMLPSADAEAVQKGKRGRGMPTDNGEIGTLYIADNDGNYHEFGGIKEINIELDESVDVMEMDFSFNDEITIPITLSRKSKKLWGKILMMPKYVITEWCFPRKKKRGTMRRNRRKGGDSTMTREEAIALLNNLRAFAEEDDEPAIDMAIEALTNVQNMHKAEWIPCSERLPKTPEHYYDITAYLACTQIGYMTSICWWDGWNCSMNEDGTVCREYEMKDIVAWMPLPKPYKEDSEV